jgi:hypothetical protein
MAAVAFGEDRQPRFIRPLIEEAASRSPKQCAESQKASLSKAPSPVSNPLSARDKKSVSNFRGDAFRLPLEI